MAKHKAIVLGCGLVGATMARELAADEGFAVTVADVSADNLRKFSSTPKIATLQADLSDPVATRNTIAPFDVVLGALPSRIGFQTLRTVIEAGKNYADISFMSEDATWLDDLAKARGVSAVVDCGVAPGLSNMIVGHVYATLDETFNIEIYVGGLPKVRRWPYQYKAPFSPADVLEEYTRPARIVEHGEVIERPALTDRELLDFDRVGTLEAFNTDGLRSLIKTVKVPRMKEKTLRYPGHCELMRTLRETGFLDLKEIEVAGVKIRPRDLTAKLLFPKWTFEPGEQEFTVMRVVIEGRKGHDAKRYTYELYDEYDAKNGVSSMARTTAFPNAIVAKMLARGDIKAKGVLPPELLGKEPGVFDHVVRELSARGVTFTERVETIPAPS